MPLNVGFWGVIYCFVIHSLFVVHSLLDLPALSSVGNSDIYQVELYQYPLQAMK